MKLFGYLSPKIYPLFPERAGKTLFGVLVQHAVDTRGAEPRFTGLISVTVSIFCGGERTERHEHQVRFADGKAEQDVIWVRANAPELGYAEMEISADRPLFSKLIQESGYGLFSGSDGRCITVNSDEKFANYRVIEQIKTWRKFCLLHSAVYVDPTTGCGNSMMLINPYDGPIVAGLKSPADRSLRVKIAAKSAEMVDLEPLVNAGEFGTVMLSANNRILVYDVKHRYGRWSDFNSIDHLDVFSGIPTRFPAPMGEALALFARRVARRSGLRYV